MDEAQAYAAGPDEDPDRYLLRRQLSGGGGTELWAAEVAGERVTLKIFRSDSTGDVDPDRWAEQAELLRLVRHPGVAGLIARFEGPPRHRPGGDADAARSTRAQYLVLDWAEGEDGLTWLAIDELATHYAKSPAGRSDAASLGSLLRGGSGWLNSRWLRPGRLAGAAAVALAVVLGLGMALGAGLSSAGPAREAATAPSPAPEPSPSPITPAPAPTESPWPGEPQGEVYIVGSVELDLCPTCRHHFDLDRNRGTVFDGRSSTDLTASVDGLGAQNLARFAVWESARTPTLADCRALPASRWSVPLIPVEAFGDSSTYCVRTTGERFGYLQPQRADGNYYFYYLLWMTPDDA